MNHIIKCRIYFIVVLLTCVPTIFSGHFKRERWTTLSNLTLKYGLRSILVFLFMIQKYYWLLPNHVCHHLFHCKSHCLYQRLPAKEWQLSLIFYYFQRHLQVNLFQFHTGKKNELGQKKRNYIKSKIFADCCVEVYLSLMSKACNIGNSKTNQCSTQELYFGGCNGCNRTRPPKFRSHKNLT